MVLVAAVGCSSSSSSTSAGDAGDSAVVTDAADASPIVTPPWLTDARIFVSGHGVTNEDCRTGICQHNENTDLVSWKGALYLVHRTAYSQVLGPNSALHIYRSTDQGKTFTQTALIPAPKTKLTPLDGVDKGDSGRDLRDPHFYVVGDTLRLKALTRLPVTSARDSNVDTIAVGLSTTDGERWSDFQAIGPTGYSYWRIKQAGGVYYNAAYRDGDQSVTLFTSTDGVSWTKGAVIYDMAVDTPLETELEIMPSGKMLALVRMDGTDDELFANKGRLRTKVCWASPPYASFDCSAELSGQRLDGPVSFQWKGRLFLVARRHLQPTNKKRTSLFELTGTLDGGPIDIKTIGDFPSAADTSYAGVVPIDDHRFAVSWYSGDVDDDLDWIQGMLGLSDIWLGNVDLALVK